MASLLPEYSYDIFISYRQKDNKHDGWVTRFVEDLKGELESTFKEEISVYFDVNPHDGILETHDVDESLRDKLKCLVFIPIISRTYCDPKSFAWEHEFKTFIKKASKDLPATYISLSAVYARLGLNDSSEYMMKRAVSIDSSIYRRLAEIYSIRGEIPEALGCIKKALDAGYRDLGWLIMDPEYQNLYYDTRYRDLLKKYFN